MDKSEKTTMFTMLPFAVLLLPVFLILCVVGFTFAFTLRAIDWFKDEVLKPY